MKAAVRRLALVAVALILLAGAAGLWFVQSTRDDRRFPQQAATVIVPRGASTQAIAQLLADRGVIANALAFRLLARYHGVGTEIRAGEFAFPAHESLEDVLGRVTTGGSQLAVWVTIPEGFTAREIAQTFADRGFGEPADLERAFLDARLRIGDAVTPNLEGYLFPDTYLVPVASSPGAIAKLLTDEFRAQLPPGADRLARTLHYSVPQIVTIASMIEREGKADDERPVIASVIYNRLRTGMRLEIDATIEYTFAHHKDVITDSDLARDSPYNTYRHDGLPPTPIANPGRSSLLAAFHPAQSDFLYYVYKGNGHHAFSRTLAEHNANVARYLR